VSDEPPRRSSLIVRFTVAYAALASLIMAGALGFLYWSTRDAQRRVVDREVKSEMDRLWPALQNRTVSEKVSVLTTWTEAEGHFVVWSLMSRTRERIAGNVPSLPAEIAAESEDFEFPIPAEPGASAQPEYARGRVVQLSSGERLLIARNVTDLKEFGGRIARASIWAFGATLVLAVAAGYGFSRSVARRLDAINRSSEAILAGDLARRIPVGEPGDEFDELAANLNRMLDRLESLMRGMREVADDIAHDMRSPISRLRSRSEVTLMGPPDAGAYRQALEQTVKDADDVLAMLNALLKIALAESGEPRDRFTEVDVAAVVRDTAEVYEPLAEDKGIALEVGAPAPVRLRGEPHLLSQAVANLLDNAVKYVPAGGHVRVSAESDGRRARVVVADDGPGIPESFREKAFDRFSRLEASRSAPGSGLGLSLVRAVVRLHGGTVTLADRSPGLEVAIELPHDARTSHRAAAAADRAAPAAADRATART